MEINTKLHKHINKFTSILNSENKLEITYRFTDKTREKITKASNTTRNQSSCFSYGLKCEREFHFYVLLLTFGKKEICMWNCVNTLLCSKQFPKVSLNVIIIVGSFTAITSSTFYLRVVEGKKCGAEGRQRRITKWKKKHTHSNSKYSNRLAGWKRMRNWVCLCERQISFRDSLSIFILVYQM